jgi:DnaJ-class molecular chaperone
VTGIEGGAGNGAPTAIEPCRRCHGFGEIVIASYAVGDDCYNDDFDTCPTCRGAGTVPVEVEPDPVVDPVVGPC